MKIKNYIFLLLIIIAFFTTSSAYANTKEIMTYADAAVVPTPRNFPRHSVDDVLDMFRITREIGKYAVLQYRWSDTNHLNVAKKMVTLSNKSGVKPIVIVNPIMVEGMKSKLDIPQSVIKAAKSNLSFSNPVIHKAYMDTVLEYARLKPAFLFLASDINVFALSNTKEFLYFTNVYKALYTKVKKISPDTKVSVGFNWEVFYLMGEKEKHKIKEHLKLIDIFRPSLDIVAFTTSPASQFKKPSSLPEDYYKRISNYISGEDDIMFLRLGWHSAGSSTEADQLGFVNRLPSLMKDIKPKIIAWGMLHDLKIPGPMGSFGLLQSDGKVKPAYSAFARLFGKKTTSDVISRAKESHKTAKPRESDYFGIYTATLDGKNVKLIISSSTQEMTHPRVSPDKKWITFTRYNKIGSGGLAREEGGYQETEVMLVRLDGTGLETLVPARKGVISGNSSWSPDGKGLIYVSTDNSSGIPQINYIDLHTRKISSIPTPKNLHTTDPHWVGDRFVFPVHGGEIDVLWSMKKDGSEAKQLTRPVIPKPKELGRFRLGDYDPRLSPDGKKVAFMRYMGHENWHIIIVDVATGVEKDLSSAKAVDAVPVWSSDGKKIMFWHADRAKLSETGLYTVNPDGSNRKIIPLPRGYHHKSPNFFPREGSSLYTRIIFSARIEPKL